MQLGIYQINIKRSIPNLLTASRGLLIPFFYNSIIHKSYETAAIILVTACITDLMDGYIARRLDVSTSGGALFDCVTDFMMVFTGYLAYWVIGLYPLWVNALNLLMFTQFIVSYRNGRLVYDPAGRVYGSLVIWVMVFTLVFPYSGLWTVFNHLILGTATVSLINRNILGNIRSEEKPAIIKPPRPSYPATPLTKTSIRSSEDD